jgi:hypothetical protein
VKLKVLLLLLLLLAILLPLSSAFQSTNVSQFGYSGIGSSVLVVAKESNVYARIEMTVQPLVNNTGVVVNGGSIQPVTLTFPNGTAITVTKTTTFNIILSDHGFFNFGTYASGPGYDVSPSHSLSLQVLNGQNATFGSIIGGIPGVDVSQYTLNGDYQLSVQALGVSL